MQPLIGDMLSDLPEISSFTMTENAQYKSEPQTPFQQFLRRSPPVGQESQKDRAEVADGFMKSRHDAERKKVLQAWRAQGGVQNVRHHQQRSLVIASL